MSGSLTDYSEEKAELVIKALRSGRRPGSVALLVGVTRKTLYNWRDERADFAELWEEAVAYAGDRMEEAVYKLGIDGDLGAAMWWLRHRRPERFDRATWIKLAILQASLKAAQANGHSRVTFEIGPDGMPTPVAAPEPEEPTVIVLPNNGRETLGGRPVPNPRNGAPEANGGITPEPPSSLKRNGSSGDEDE